MRQYHMFFWLSNRAYTPGL